MIPTDMRSEKYSTSTYIPEYRQMIVHIVQKVLYYIVYTTKCIHMTPTFPRVPISKVEWCVGIGMYVPMTYVTAVASMY